VGGQARNGNLMHNGASNNAADLNDSLTGAQNGQLKSGGGHETNDKNSGHNQNESNHLFDKILSEVIHVSAYDQRLTSGMGYQSGGAGSGAGGTGDLMGHQHPVEDMPFKIKGLLEPQFNQTQHLTLPDGVPAPLAVLTAQPPYSADIDFINSTAAEASNCIGNFTLDVPENVAFDFQQIV
jgi:hypothetical protein